MLIKDGTLKHGDDKQDLKTVERATHRSSKLVDGVHCLLDARRFSRYQRGNQNSQIEEGEITQLSKEKRQKCKQRSTKHKH